MDNQEHEHVFTELGGSIGRNPLNDWIICDHKRFISGKHAEVFFRDNSFFLTDTSTNGVYLNDGAEPIGNGNSIPLSENDRLNFGELNVSVNIESGQTSQHNQATNASTSANTYASTGAGNTPGNTNSIDNKDDLFADLLGDFGAPAPQSDSTPYEAINSEANIDQLIGVSSTPDIGTSDIEITDPLAILDGKSSSGSDSLAQEPLVADSFSRELLEGGSALNTPFSPPVGKPEAQIPEDKRGESVIPNNWDPLADLLNEPASPPPAKPQSNGHRTAANMTAEVDVADQTLVNGELDIMDLIGGGPAASPSSNRDSAVATATRAPQTQQANEHIARQQTTQTRQTQQPGVRDSSEELINTILASAGLNPAVYSPEQKQKLPALFGTMLRGCLDGLVTALMARNQVKSGLRMAVTTIAPVENNPLKFSINGEEALRNLLSAREGYLGPKDAIAEGYQDLQIHQLAMMSATQKTLQALVQRFNPDSLAQQFEQTKSSGLKLGTKKMHYWDQYQNTYKNIEETINEDFQNLLGDVFADAYEEQTQRAKQSL